MKTSTFDPTLALGGLSLTSAWGASAWVETPEPVVNSPEDLYSVAAIADNDVWTVGTYYNSSYLTLTEHWDGSAWSVVSSPNQSSRLNFLHAVTAGSSRDVWAGGWRQQGNIYQTLIEHWNGRKWSIVPSANTSSAERNYIYGMDEIAPDDVWAVGQSLSPSNTPLTMHWDGVTWSIVPTPPVAGGLVDAVSGTAANDVWAVGTAGTGTLTMHWDGSTWAVVPSPNISSQANSLGAVVAIAPDNAWAVGVAGLNTVGDGLTIHWDGIAWSVVPVPPQSNSSQFAGVAARSATRLTLVGQVSTDGALAEDYSNHAWQVSPLPPLGAEAHLNSVSVSRQGTLWAVGLQDRDSSQLILMRPR